MIKISPSVLACDLASLGAETAAMQRAGADMIHLDIMDGHFVPNISFGAPVVKSLRKASGIFFDVHLMIDEPLRYSPDFIKAGADLITFHIECGDDAGKTIRLIKSAGIRAGLVLKPKTPAKAVEAFLPVIDIVLVMTVEPGFGGQAFMADMLPKITELRRMADRLNPGLDIEVDGGIDCTTAPLAARAGANVFVAGSSLFGQDDYAAAVRALRSAAED